jgi:hypothetical protein
MHLLVGWMNIKHVWSSMPPRLPVAVGQGWQDKRAMV